MLSGKDELSVTLSSALEDPRISKSLGTESFVNVKLENDSESHKLFTDICKYFLKVWCKYQITNLA